MSEANNNEDTLVFAQEDDAEVGIVLPPWRVLIVDDEPDVHDATVVALRNQLVLGRGIEFSHAYSAVQAESMLAANNDLAAVILDVVMETSDAGLRLVQFIRHTLKNDAIRILLRTGQPGYAPEIETIRAYDINDYASKPELTRIRLFTCLTVALRAYSQIHRLDANRHGLERVIAASRKLTHPTSLRQFAEETITQLSDLLHTKVEGYVCVAPKTGSAGPTIIAATGRYSSQIGQPLATLADSPAKTAVERSLAERCNNLGDSIVLFVGTPGNVDLTILISADEAIDQIGRSLLELFCTHLSVTLENAQLYDRVSALAYTDSLLGIPNRNGLARIFAQRTVDLDTLAVIDIDGFADINNTLDQGFGDTVLKAVAQRLQRSLPAPTVVSRLGGDLFGLIGPSAMVTAEQLTAVLAAPLELSGQVLRITATSGICRIPEVTNATFSECLKNATIALKHAKLINRGGALYHTEQLAQAVQERTEMLSRLRLAFSSDRLSLLYLPIVDLATGRLLGAEALLRWRNEAGEDIPTTGFQPAAEQSGLMVAIGNWAIGESFRFLRTVLDAGFPNFRVAINISLAQFREPDFVDRLVMAIKDHGIGAFNIEIELTESVAIDHIDLIRQKIVALQVLGISVTIDGFGTGYSSLNVLRQLNVDCLKIDRSFVAGTSQDAKVLGVSQMVLQLSQQLGLKTTAEGIESEDQAKRLLRLGCRNGQGDYYSPPLTAESLLRLLEEKHSLP